MKHSKYLTIITLVFISQALLSQTKKTVASFDKVIISPHIETTFVQGDEESVTILDSTEPENKINIEVKGETLRVYLDDANETTKSKKIVKDGIKMKVPIYKGKVLTILVTYKHINELSLRGEQRTECKDLIDVEKFKLKIYGESQVVLSEVNLKELDVDIYGESELTIEKGTINHQKITAYGEGEINLIEVDNKTSKLKAFGEAEFIINASEHIRFTAYGEAKLRYKGNANVDKGLSFGDSEVERIN
ncbi:head GIN domain-containing protein [Pontimicrobium sp. SW4]|uniref:Head GIN domain-containing protein n=1 Tax=Pontimicrobium sp. SW4 TaxID=3153519 RepID=A0AAU7BU07_9FLAO